MSKSNALVLAALLLLFGGITGIVVQQALAQPAPPPNPGPPRPAEATKAAKPAATQLAARALVFRDIPSWDRHPDFEDALSSMDIAFDVKPSSDMAKADLAPYRFIIIPGAQHKMGFYQQYAEHAERFERYVTNGGTLVLELNGAENDGIILPRGVSMVRHGSRENSILIPGHPIVIPMGGKNIRASYASHGYLDGVPKDALVLMTETVEGEADKAKPTFIEYADGAGRVIAACQCFHDRDRSGRGPLMETVISYSVEKKWFSPKK